MYDIANKLRVHLINKIEMINIVIYNNVTFINGQSKYSVFKHDSLGNKSLITLSFQSVVFYNYTQRNLFNPTLFASSFFQLFSPYMYDIFFHVIWYLFRVQQKSTKTKDLFQFYYFKSSINHMKMLGESCFEFYFNRIQPKRRDFKVILI